ncbi:serine--tRNA ligase [Paenibacillus harenae]|uniref:Serine--tRNA ligase n=1 Tax=Paenibacillus harenae TaxID=306543 RepID=A0ABT9U2Q7_PAEHA|nr:serine--tRNA ligase [Paenibacillus harenae]MDQ0113908.1 seryl-tRNA synthetase [Paenibacillus harenae]
MLNMAFIREHQAELERIAAKKGIEVSIRELIELDDKKRGLLQSIEGLRHMRNELSEQIGRKLSSGEEQDADRMKQKVKQSNATLTKLEAELGTVDGMHEQLLLLVPNIVSPDTPDGASDADNVEIKKHGELPTFEFEPKNHVELAENLGMLDIARGVKIGGSRNYVLKGAGFHLHHAVQRLAVDVLEAGGFMPMDVPMLARGESFRHSGFLPLGQEQLFRLEEDNKYLIGTSEVSLVSGYSDEIVDVHEPIRLAAMSACFRQEIGSAGRDVHGLYRVHQFSKVEQVVLCENDPELSERILQEMTANAERILQLLELPYRVVAVCIGDMSQKTYKQYDIETWMPSRQAFGETHSSSNLLDFQARRAKIRYRAADGKLQYCHTLNNTAVATPRILIPLLENHQREDGSIYIPKALRPYMKGLEYIGG